MITRRLLEVGKRRGYNIRISSVRPGRRESHESPDLSLFIDVFNHAHSLKSLGAWRTFGDRFLNELMERGPFVHLMTAYADVCNLPYLPCSGQRLNGCPMKPALPLWKKGLFRDWSDDCFAKRTLVSRLFEQAALAVYLSPLHRRITESLLSGVKHPPTFILRPLIDTRRFYNEGLERDIDYLFVGVIGEAKGLAAMRERFGHTDIHLIGRCAPGVKLDFGRYLGPLPYEEIPRYMNRAKHFVFLPRWPEPQGRVVAEAALCGCEITGNDNIGALSFEADLSDPSFYAGAEEEFWITLEKLVR
ncbi:MAG: glycosyltransferase [Nitrospira sp.]|nr:glycosyltransferase [Nitrospira sp.]